MRKSIVCHLIGLSTAIFHTANASERTMQAPGKFTLVSESIDVERQSDGLPDSLTRTYELEDGARVALVHTIMPDGMLELEAAKQSEAALSTLDQYCAKIDAEVIRTGITTLTRQTQTLLSCGRSSGKEDMRRASSTNAKRSAAIQSNCDPTMSITLDGNGSVYRGDPAGFAAHIDAEWEATSSQLVTWNASFLPGCRLGESSMHSRWAYASRSIICGTQSVPVGMHQGSGKIEVCNRSDYGYLTTEVWSASGS